MAIVTVTVIAVSSLVGFLSYSYFGTSSCIDTWKPEHFKELRLSLQSKLYGQHIAQEIVQEKIRKHLRDKNPKKALVMSLHGTTGCGKNYLWKIVSGKLLSKEMRKEYVQHWKPMHHFSDKNRILQYRDDLRKTVIEKLKGCARSIFVFDEAHEIPPGLMDILSSCFVKSKPWLGGQDCSKATFIFISNTGALNINQIVYKLMKTKQREDLKLEDFQTLIDSGTFKEPGGFHKNGLSGINIIDHYVPFLPLTKIHVKQCIEYFLKSRDCPFGFQTVDALAEYISYEHGFSPYGCRGVDNIIKVHINDECVWRSPKDDL